jgi:hypothetical protein
LRNLLNRTRLREKIAGLPLHGSTECRLARQYSTLSSEKQIYFDTSTI